MLYLIRFWDALSSVTWLGCWPPQQPSTVSCLELWYIKTKQLRTKKWSQFLITIYRSTQIFTYTVIALGFFLFINGMIGWVGSVTQMVWLIRMVSN